MAGGAHPYAEDLSAVRNLSPAEIVKGWESAGAALSDRSIKRILALDRQMLVEAAADRLDGSYRLADMKVPGLLVCGTKDWRFDDVGRFAQVPPGWQAIPVEGADRLQAWIQSERVVPHVKEFLRSVATGRG
ncbi:MAG: hypothetical protein HY678_09035 [Chloroflexi bacterium]|nr:hypothetical protein [Chloroflexota bacterium]